MPTPDYKYHDEKDVIDLSDFYIVDAVARAYQATLLNGGDELRELAREVHQHPKSEILSQALAGFLAATDDVGVIYYFSGIYDNIGYADAD